MMETDLQRKLARSGRFDDAAEIEVAAIEVNDFGEGEYEARLAYPPGSAATSEAGHLFRLKHALEEALPRAWVVAFTVDSHAAAGDEVQVTFDYLPEVAPVAS